MGCRNVGRTLLCASAFGLVAAVAPGAASAGLNPTVDCFGTANGGTPTKHEVGEPEADGYCTPRADGPDSYSIVITQQPEAGSAMVKDNGTAYPYIVYTASEPGVNDGYSFHAVNGEGSQISNTSTVLTNNVAATNDPPRCLGQQFDDGPPQDLAIGQERFAGGCFDDEGESGPLTIQVVQNPSRGTLRVDTTDPSRPLVYYRASCSGPDDYSFTASDGVNTSAIFAGSVTNAAGTPCTGAPAAAAPAKPVTTPAPAAKFSLGKVPSSVTVDSSGNASIPVTGTPGSKGSVSITAEAPKSASASAFAKKKKAKKAKTLSLGSKRFTLPASGSTKVKVKVGGKGLKALKKAKKLSAKVTVKTDKVSVTKKFTLKAPKAKSKKRK